MKKTKISVAVLGLCLVMFVAALFLPNKVYAVSGIISGIKDLTFEGQSESNCYGSFKATFKYGEKCAGNICGIAVNHFKCITEGTHYCPSEHKINKIEVTVADNDYVTAWKNRSGKRDFVEGHPNYDMYDYYKVTMYTNNTYQNVEGIVYKRKDTYEGKVNVSGATTHTMDYTQTSVARKTYTVSGCDNGCSITFTHSVHRKTGNSGNTAYSITKTQSNTTTNLGNGNTGDLTKTDTTTIKTGERVCEILTFKPYPGKTDQAIVPVCVAAISIPIPDPTAGIKMQVKNEDAPKYTSYGEYAYAKPGDSPVFKATYNPPVQSFYNFGTPERVSLGNDSSCPSGMNTTVDPPAPNINSSKSLGALFDSCFSPKWNNAFTMRIGQKYHATTNDSSAKSARTKKGTIGSDAEYYDEDSRYGKVAANRVGYAITGTAATNYTSGTKYTPGGVSYSLDSEEANVARVDVSVKDDDATVYVPYNFETESEITTKPTKEDKNGEIVPDHLLYAGEETTIEYNVRLNKKTNSETTDGSEENAYVTKADEVRRTLVVFNPDDGEEVKSGGIWSGSRYASPCSYFGRSENSTADRYCDLSNDHKTKTLDPSNQNDGWQSESLNFLVKDSTAGSKVCVAVAVFPATSGADTNWNDTESYKDSSGRSYWRISNPECYTVAKRPSIQFWGGNVYSRANLSTSTAVKYNLAGYHTYSAKTKKGTFAFGSWGELGVVANGSVSRFGSGASMSYASNNNGNLSPDPFGENTSSSASNPGGAHINLSQFCKFVPLTIPNSACSGGTAGGLSSVVTITNAASDKEYIVKLLASGNDTANHDHFPNDRSISTDNITEVNGGTTKVISSDGNITITSDLDYLSGEYKNYGQMPKLVIYAKKNIYIDCGVSRIDALLIADDTVVTCNNLGDIYGLPASELTKKIEATINNPENSNQLVVNGAIIAKRLIPNRTYGAATGANSIVPAEVVNFDPTLYQFGSSAETDDDTTGRLDITYIHEIAPRI